MKVDVAQVPPSRKALTKVDDSKLTAFTVSFAIEFVGVVVPQLDRLNDSQSVTVHTKGVRLTQSLKGARGIVVLHPVNVDAHIVLFARAEGSSAQEVDRTFVMDSATIVAFVRAPHAEIITITQIPTFSIFPLIGPTQLQEYYVVRIKRRSKIDERRV